jgi:hypothetical protein
MSLASFLGAASFGLLNVAGTKAGAPMNPSGTIPMDKRTTQLQKRTYKQAETNYQMASQGGWTVNLAAPIIAGLKSQAEQIRRAEMDTMMAAGARSSNTTEFVPGNSLSQLMAGTGDRRIAGALAPVNARADAMRGNYLDAIQTGQGIYGMEQKKRNVQYQAQLGKYVNNLRQDAAMAGAWGGMASGMGSAFAAGR